MQFNSIKINLNLVDCSIFTVGKCTFIVFLLIKRAGAFTKSVADLRKNSKRIGPYPSYFNYAGT